MREKMRRLAIFVEGYTELLFTDRIITEIASMNQIAIEHQQIRGGGRSGKSAKKIKVLTAPLSTQEKVLYVLIVDCGNDRLVAQRIREEHASLTAKGYEKIVGLRDVFPEFTKEEIPKLRRGMYYGIKKSLAPVKFILSVMEIEAWFLAEHKHFPLVDPAITVAEIRMQLGFDPESDDMSNRLTPRSDLEAAYVIGGKVYEKGNADCTINKLDYEYMYTDLKSRIPDLAELISTIDHFLTNPETLVDPIERDQQRCQE
jgi:hypothetical protein